MQLNCPLYHNNEIFKHIFWLYAYAKPPRLGSLTCMVNPPLGAFTRILIFLVSNSTVNLSTSNQCDGIQMESKTNVDCLSIGIFPITTLFIMTWTTCSTPLLSFTFHALFFLSFTYLDIPFHSLP
jgi:hypothetical protein